MCQLSVFTSVLGYSLVSKNPLLLEFYGFSRCHATNAFGLRPLSENIVNIICIIKTHIYI